MRKIKLNKTYWFLQLLGWGGMVVLEMINYTFFLVGYFSWDYLFQFMLFGACGIIVTHTIRFLVNKYKLFNQPSWRIWLIAGLSVIFGSITSIFLLFLPSLILQFQETLDSLTGIYVFGLIMNNGRYLLMWIIIYFLYKVLQIRNEATEQKMMAFQKARIFEYELLKKQINPHFLFNALNSIKALITLDVDKSKAALVSLSELLRYTLNYEGHQLVIVRDEVEEVKKYLDLEILRYGKRLTIIYNIEPEAEKEFIPAVSILTLAENAIKHGLSVHSGNFLLSITIGFDPEGMYLKVVNTGTLSGIPVQGGIGLRNIKRQLETHYGEKSTFTLQENNGEVSAVIHIRNNENQHHPHRRRAIGYSGINATLK
jgi:sensor histidine kinase YesM